MLIVLFCWEAMGGGFEETGGIFFVESDSKAAKMATYI